MSWRKHFTPVSADNNSNGSYSPFSNARNSAQAGPAKANYSSYLPDIYVGTPNRVERYGQYNTMDQDSEVNAALDILAEFCTQKNKQNNTPFTTEYKSEATNSEVKIIQEYLQQWAKLQDFETKIFRILRNVFKFGDQFFLRDPETKKWFNVDPANVTKIIVNESEGKIPEQYVIKNVNFNFVAGIATTPYESNNSTYGGGNTTYQPVGNANGMAGQPQSSTSASRFMTEQNEYAVNAEHMVHISLSEGLDNNFPFGNSLLETIFKVYKQKELLEDAIIIYRVQRAPERRVFYVDVGNMPSHLAMQFVERVKTEIHQRRIPSSTGGGQNVIDSSYNPLCLDLSTRIPLLDGRTLALTELIAEFEQGKENWAYSCDPVTGKIAPGVINWAGITRRNTQTIQLTFDNGETLVCTPDHKIPVFGKGMVEAKDIVETDSLISFNKRNKKISSNSNDYEQVWDHSKKDWQWTHRVVGEFFRNLSKHQEFTYLEQNAGKSKAVIHHRDYNRFNNDPRNLQYMNKADHIQYQAEQTVIQQVVLPEFGNLITNEQQLARVTKTENVSNRDTGTITIDGTEKWHNYHTFAIESGIFVKNSINEDYFFPQTCLSLETPIPLLDGRTLTLDEIILEYKNGKRNWTYGLSNITHEMESAEIKWAGITRKNAKVLKITLDNGETITSTPDHRFIMRDGREVEAQHLLINDSLMPLELRDGYSGPKQKNKKYTRYRSNNEGSIKFVHATVANKQPGKDTQVHHVDFNSKNNNPTNLQVMLTADHIELHRNAGSYSINKQWNNPESRQKLLDGMKNLYANADSCFMEKISKRNQKNALAGWSKISSESRQSVYKSLQLSRNKNSAAKTINFSINMFNKMKEAFDTGNDSISKLSVHLRNNEEFQQSFKDANTNLKRDKNKSSNLQVTDTTLNKIVGVVGYRTFGDWKKDYTGQHSKFSNKQNHKVASIEWLTETMDTGDITVLSDSNSHWFGLAAGIYVHNSEGRGSKVETLPGGCFSMDTRVSLLDGRELSISDIEAEMSTGKTLWTYSTNPETGQVVPGIISWAGVTQESAQVMRLTLDNGEHIICTPDHQFPVYGKGFVRAEHLYENESMIPLYKKKEFISKNKKLAYEQYFDNAVKEWKFTHRMVADYLPENIVKNFVYKSNNDNKFNVRHHVDFNRYNNDPSNLVLMGWKDHQTLHMDYGFDEHSQKLGSSAAKAKLSSLKENDKDAYDAHCKNISMNLVIRWDALSDIEKSTITDKMSLSAKVHIASLSQEDRKLRNEQSKKNLQTASTALVHKLKTDPDFNYWFRERQRAGWTAELRNSRSEWATKNNKEVLWGINGDINRKNHKLRQQIDYSYDMLNFIIDCVKGKTTHQVTAQDVTLCFNSNAKLVSQLHMLNKNKKVPNWKPSDKFTTSMVKVIPLRFGYSSWKDFRQKESVHNHRVVKIEYLDDAIPVGTLTIDQDEIHHNYHTFALTAGIFTKNSNLGEIDDLRYFTNKMVRALRIPSSYLPTGAEDSAAQMNDGRVGTAYIQELRFNTYCERLQTLVVGEFDQEFKIYLLEKGVNIDTSMFDLKFQPPQNFAAYRQSELDNARIPTFTQMSAVPYISNRFAMKRFLGMTDEEIMENERLWREENEDELGGGAGDASAEMRDAGISGAGIESDIDGIEDEMPDDTAPIIGNDAGGGDELPTGGGEPPPA